MKSKRFLALLLVALGLFTYHGFKKDRPLFKTKEERMQALTDGVEYRSFCRRAASDAALFACFKNHPIYNVFEERCSVEEGRVALNWIKEHAPQLLRQQEIWGKNDRVGAPRLASYPEVMDCSPTTLRYVQMAGLLQERLGDLSGLRVAEIGGGYGGLCQVLSSLFSRLAYSLIDLPAPLELAQKYLTGQEVQYISCEALPGRIDCDLVLSLSGFAESDRTLQDQLLEQVIRHAPRGFLFVYSLPRYFGVFPYSHAELKKKLEGYGLDVSVVPMPEWGVDGEFLVWDVSQ